MDVLISCLAAYPDPSPAQNPPTAMRKLFSASLILVPITFTLPLRSQDVAVGVDPSGWDAPFEYESVSVASGRNLRLQSPEGVYFHAGGYERGGFSSGGNFLVHGSFWTGTGKIVIQKENSSLEGGELYLESASPSWAGWGIDHYAGQLRFYNGTAYNVFMPNGDALFNGKVGIGTTSPDYKLDVNGAIRAKEFFVETGWADFVFQDDYQLPSLREVKSHIEEHGHLPGVPSAAEVQANGLEMGQAQTLMMQKIEELTLYVLQLSDENAELKSRLAKIENGHSDL